MVPNKNAKELKGICKTNEIQSSSEMDSEKTKSKFRPSALNSPSRERYLKKNRQTSVKTLYIQVGTTIQIKLTHGFRVPS